MQESVRSHIPRRNSSLFTTAVIFLLWALVPTAWASNGTNLPAYSAAALGLGGADLVSVADTSQLNNNPAALSLISSHRGDFTLMYIQPLLHYQDASNNLDGRNDGYLPMNVGYAQRLGGSELWNRFTIGAGIFSQGGFGTNYQRVNTIFGTTDSASSFLRYVKFTVGLSYDAVTTDRHKLSIGVAPHFGYSDVALSLFPGTSVAPIPNLLPSGFAGVNIKDSCARNLGLGAPLGSCPHDWVAGVKLGFMYSMNRPGSSDHARPLFAFGASYTSPVNFTYTGAHLDVNLSSLGLGTVSYDAKVEGFKWPEQVDVGFAYRPMDWILLALDVSWMHWSTINTVTVSGSNPKNAVAAGIPALSNVSLPLVLNWKDQAVIAIGTAYDLDEHFQIPMTVRAGYNYSNNIVPDQHLTPLAPLIIEHHFTGGIGYRFRKNVSADIAGLYGLKNTQNATGFLTPGIQSTSGYFIYSTLSWLF
ncbi:MAG: OmpP1/FadL family transporter [Nitrospiraceae bacterium]